MTYGSIVKSSASNGSELITEIKTQLSSSGWTTADGGTTYTSPNASPALQVSFASTSLATNGVLQMNLGISGNTKTCYAIAGNSTLTGSAVGLEYSISNTHFYINIIGPNKGSTGRLDATYGSTKSFMLLTTYTPYFASNSTTSRHWVVAAGFYSAPGTPSVTTLPTSTALVHYPNPSTGTLESAQLLTTRLAIQDQTAVGDLLPNKTVGGSEIYWPFVICSLSLGVIGRLNNVFFGGDNYTVGVDTTAQLHNRSSVIINGERYARQLPAFWPNSTSLQWYTPFGTCEVATNKECGVPITNGSLIDITTGAASVGGPNIVVKRGDGS